MPLLKATPFRREIYGLTFTEKPARTRWEVRIKCMNSSTKDKIKGRIHEAKGKVKEEAGKAIGDPDLRDRGTAEKVAGKVQNKLAAVKKVFGK
jgi:uncharacterized protein YjbJ (UPF0337 family)